MTDDARERRGKRPEWSPLLAARDAELRQRERQLASMVADGYFVANVSTPARMVSEETSERDCRHAPIAGVPSGPMKHGPGVTFSTEPRR